MISEMLKKNIMFVDEVDSWEEAIKKSCEPLLNNGCVSLSYVDAIIENVKTNGSYFVLLPEIALPHARHEHGAIKKGVSCTVLNKRVMFPNDKPVKVLIAISSDGDDGHLEMLSEIGSVLMEDELVEKLKNATTVQEISSIFSNNKF